MPPAKSLTRAATYKQMERPSVRHLSVIGCQTKRRKEVFWYMKHNLGCLDMLACFGFFSLLLSFDLPTTAAMTCHLFSPVLVAVVSITSLIFSSGLAVVTSETEMSLINRSAAESCATIEIDWPLISNNAPKNSSHYKYQIVKIF